MGVLEGEVGAEEVGVAAASEEGELVEDGLEAFQVVDSGCRQEYLALSYCLRKKVYLGLQTLLASQSTAYCLAPEQDSFRSSLKLQRLTY